MRHLAFWSGQLTTPHSTWSAGTATCRSCQKCFLGPALFCWGPLKGDRPALFQAGSSSSRLLGLGLGLIPPFQPSPVGFLTVLVSDDEQRRNRRKWPENMTRPDMATEQSIWKLPLVLFPLVRRARPVFVSSCLD